LKDEQAAEEARVKRIHEKMLARQKAEAERRREREANERQSREQEEIDRLEREKGEQMKNLRQIEAEREKSRKAMADRLALEAAKAARHDAWVKGQQEAEEVRLKRRRLEQQAHDKLRGFPPAAQACGRRPRFLPDGFLRGIDSHPLRWDPRGNGHDFWRRCRSLVHAV
jgi:hypothetical protein